MRVQTPWCGQPRGPFKGLGADAIEVSNYNHHPNRGNTPCTIASRPVLATQIQLDTKENNVQDTRATVRRAPQFQVSKPSAEFLKHYYRHASVAKWTCTVRCQVSCTIIPITCCCWQPTSAQLIARCRRRAHGRLTHRDHDFVEHTVLIIQFGVAGRVAT